MKITPEQHIEMSLDRIRPIFLLASKKIEALKDGERLAATNLAKEIAGEMGVKWEPLYQVLLYFYRGYPGFHYQKGGGGGFQRIKEEKKEESK